MEVGDLLERQHHREADVNSPRESRALSTLRFTAVPEKL